MKTLSTPGPLAEKSCIHTCNVNTGIVMYYFLTIVNGCSLCVCEVCVCVVCE